MRPSLAPGSPPRSIDLRGSGPRLIHAVVVLAVLIHELLIRCMKGAHSRVAQQRAPSSRRGRVVMDGPGLPRRTIPSRGGRGGGVDTGQLVGPPENPPASHPDTHPPLTRGRDFRQFPRVGRWAHPTLTRGRDQSAEPGVNLPASAHAHPHEGDMTNQQNLGSTRARIPPSTRGRAVPRAQASTRTRASMSALSAPTSFSRSTTRCCPPSIPSNLSGTGGR